jgi:hypothetical protein
VEGGRGRLCWRRRWRRRWRRKGKKGVEVALEIGRGGVETGKSVGRGFVVRDEKRGGKTWKESRRLKNEKERQGNKQVVRSAECS